nr:hypothetical protein [Tanacetum cinerariifolium]
MASLSRRLCGRETAHALVEKKGKAKDRIMPPKYAPLTQAAIRQMIEDNVDAAITAERARQANIRNDASGSGSARGQDAVPTAREYTFDRFAAATLQGPALTWWNSKTVTMGLETVNRMPWTEMEQPMTAEFFPIDRFNELALMCPRMVKPERVKKWTKDHPLHKIIGDPKLSVRTRGQLANSCLFSCLLSSIEPANVAEALRDTDCVSTIQKELDQFVRLNVWRLVPRPEGKSVIKTK